MINPDLKSEVEILIDEIERTHRYSMSRIYRLWNLVFDKDETPQSCASCLIRKTKDLRKWLDAENNNQQEQKPEPKKEKTVRKSRKKTNTEQSK